MRPYLVQARLRAEALIRLRAFFHERNVLEVETPLLSRGASHDCHIDVFGVETGGAHSTRYLQTSPEPHMKRLLAKGFPDIFQICKSFRLGEKGNVHNPEFTMVEWYRKGMGLEGMIAETLEICAAVAGPHPVQTMGYRETFAKATGLDPLEAGLPALRSHSAITGRGLADDFFQNRSDLLNFLMSEVVEPALDPAVFTVVKGFPAELSSQAALDPENPGTCLRFEVFGKGMELGNGYQELTDPAQYRARFEAENLRREAQGKSVIPLDPAYFHDITSGIPPCSGVGLGLDRLLLIASGNSALESVLTFPWEDA